MNPTLVRLLQRLFSAVTLVIVVTSPAVTSAASDRIQAQAATWSTWLLSTASELRIGPPPDAAETRAELAELEALADQRDALALERITYWDAGAPPYRWTQRAVKYAQNHGVTGPRAFRLTALLNAAISDAVVATADSQLAHNRARPALSSAALVAPATPGYPDERAAAAGAAETVLAYVFPTDVDLFATWPPRPRTRASKAAWPIPATAAPDGSWVARWASRQSAGARLMART